MRRLLQFLLAPQIAERKQTEQLIARFERLQQLREIAYEQRNWCKIWQANRLIQATTKELNKRYTIALNN
jgi:hypothetical protein